MANDQTPQPPAAPEFDRAILPPERSRRRNLSRAVAGMALAVIVAVTAAATELSLDLWGRHAIYSRRLAQARMRLDQTNLADQRALALAATVRWQSQRYNDLDTLLLAPDLQLIRVSGVAPAPSGVILFSPASGRALLTITGLSELLPGRHYQLASLDRRGAAHPLAQFDAANDPALIDLPDLAAALTPTSQLTLISPLP
jgi:hypothetical protein